MKSYWSPSTRCLNHVGDKLGVFQDILVDTIAVDTLPPCTPKSFAAMMVIVVVLCSLAANFKSLWCYQFEDWGGMQTYLYVLWKQFWVMIHNDLMTWKCFQHYWPFVRGNHQWLVSSHKGPAMWNFDVFLDVSLNKLFNRNMDATPYKQRFS